MQNNVCYYAIVLAHLFFIYIYLLCSSVLACISTVFEWHAIVQCYWGIVYVRLRRGGSFSFICRGGGGGEGRGYHQADSPDIYSTNGKLSSMACSSISDFILLGNARFKVFHTSVILPIAHVYCNAIMELNPDFLFHMGSLSHVFKRFSS